MCEKSLHLMPVSSVFSCACCRLLVSWVCCGVSASSPVCTRSTLIFPCRSTHSSSMASWCSSSSIPSRPATTNHVSGSSSCWSVKLLIYWSIFCNFSFRELQWCHLNLGATNHLQCLKMCLTTELDKRVQQSTFMDRQREMLTAVSQQYVMLWTTPIKN